MDQRMNKMQNLVKEFIEKIDRFEKQIEGFQNILDGMQKKLERDQKDQWKMISDITKKLDTLN